MGYHRAGFEVVGCDIEPQPHNPHECYQDDALVVLDILLSGGTWRGYTLADFDGIHASPPCQEYSQSRHIRKVASIHGVKHAPMLIRAVRERLEASGLPWVIENVEGSPLPDAIELCGSMFGLPIRRHRWFSSNVFLWSPGPCQHTHSCINPVGGKIRGYGTLASATTYTDSKGRVRKREGYYKLSVGREAMDIDWMNLDELSQAIPPHTPNGSVNRF